MRTSVLPADKDRLRTEKPVVDHPVPNVRADRKTLVTIRTPGHEERVVIGKICRVDAVDDGEKLLLSIDESVGKESDNATVYISFGDDPTVDCAYGWSSLGYRRLRFEFKNVKVTQANGKTFFTGSPSDLRTDITVPER